MSIEYLFELGGENTNVARYEVETVLECEGYNPREVFNQHSAVTFNLSKSLNENTINRLGMTKRISKVIHSSNNKDIKIGSKTYTQIHSSKEDFGYSSLREIK